MPTRAEMQAEELVYEVAAELGLTDSEVLRLDALAIAAGVLHNLRIELKKQAGWQLTVHDYRLPSKRPAVAVPIVVEEPLEA